MCFCLLIKTESVLESSSLELDLRFSELLELSLGLCGHSCPGCCVHTYIVAGFWTLCQLWVLELSWEEFSTLATGVHDPAYLQLEQLPLGCGASTMLSYQDVSWRMLSCQDIKSCSATRTRLIRDEVLEVCNCQVTLEPQEV